MPNGTTNRSEGAVARSCSALLGSGPPRGLPEIGLVANRYYAARIEWDVFVVANSNDLRPCDVNLTVLGSIVESYGNAMRSVAPFSEGRDVVGDIVREAFDDAHHAWL